MKGGDAMHYNSTRKEVIFVQDQNFLINKTDKLRTVLNKSGDSLILHNVNCIPEGLKRTYDELTFNIDSIDSIIYRAAKPEVLDWCEKLIGGVTKQVNEFNFIVALYNNKSYTE